MVEKRGVIMPRVKPLIRPDPLDVQVAQVIGAVMIVCGLNIDKLSELTGISPATLARRIGTKGNLDDLKLGEFKKIRQVGIDRGVFDEGEQL